MNLQVILLRQVPIITIIFKIKKLFGIDSLITREGAPLRQPVLFGREAAVFQGDNVDANLTL